MIILYLYLYLKKLLHIKFKLIEVRWFIMFGLFNNPMLGKSKPQNKKKEETSSEETNSS